MKKSLVIISSSLLTLILILLCLPALVGYILKPNLKSFSMSNSLLFHQYHYKLLSYHQGWFHSQITFQVTTKEDGKQLKFKLPLKITHGPYWIHNGQIKFGMAYLTSKINFPQDHVTAYMHGHLDRQYNIYNHINLHFNYPSTAPGLVQIKHFTINYKESADGKHFKTNTIIKGVSLLTPSGDLVTKLGNLTIKLNADKRKTHWKLLIDTHLKNFSETVYNPKLKKATLSIARSNIKNFHYNTKFNQKIREIFSAKKILNETPDDISKQFINLLGRIKFFSKNTKIQFDKVGFTTPLGNANINLNLSFNKLPQQASFNSARHYLQGNFAINVPIIHLEKNPQNIFLLRGFMFNANRKPGKANLAIKVGKLQLTSNNSKALDLNNFSLNINSQESKLITDLLKWHIKHACIKNICINNSNGSLLQKNLNRKALTAFQNYLLSLYQKNSNKAHLTDTEAAQALQIILPAITPKSSFALRQQTDTSIGKITSTANLSWPNLTNKQPTLADITTKAMLNVQIQIPVTFVDSWLQQIAEKESSLEIKTMDNQHPTPISRIDALANFINELMVGGHIPKIHQNYLFKLQIHNKKITLNNVPL